MREAAIGRIEIARVVSQYLSYSNMTYRNAVLTLNRLKFQQLRSALKPLIAVGRTTCDCQPLPVLVRLEGQTAQNLAYL